MVKINTKRGIHLIKIGFRSILDAKRANKYLGKNEHYPLSMSIEISESQKQILDDNYISYFEIE